MDAAASVVLGQLVATAKGSVTRKRMARKVTYCAEDVEENLTEYIDATSEEYDTFKEGAMDCVNNGKEKARSCGGSNACQASPMHNRGSWLPLFMVMPLLKCGNTTEGC